ncbi:MAG: restriction endonuclease subunit S [Sutterella wadsworthensis]|nr:restriction endonuclease subunit S [Sutterella wadsworthensis]
MTYWFGSLPHGWEAIKLKYLVNLRQDEPDKKSNYIGLEHIEQGTGNICGRAEHPIDGNAIQFNVNDVLFGKLRPYLRKVWIADFNGCASKEILVMQPLKINAAFLFFVLLSHDFIELVNGSTFGAKMPRSDWSFIGNQFIPVPPKKIQERIANNLKLRLGICNQFILENQDKLNRLSEYRQSLITQAVTRGLDPNVEMKDSGIDGVGPIAATWFVIPFGKIVQFGRGLPITKANLTESGVPCLSYGGIHAKGNRFITAGVNSLPFVSEDYIDEYPESLIDKGDLVFADTSEDLSGSGNFSCIRSEGKIFAGYHTIICRLSERFKINHIFIGYLLDSSVFRRQIQRRVTGVKVYSVTQQILKSTKVWLPKIEEQEKIARYLDEKCSLIDSTVSEINKSIKKLQEYRSGLISAAVTGKIDISEVNQ